MASISKTISKKTGVRLTRVLFVGADGKRRALYLGKASNATAQTVKLRVEELVDAARAKRTVDKPTAAWLEEIDDSMLDKLAAAGLTRSTAAKARDSLAYSMTLEGWLDTFIDGRRGELKPGSIKKLEWSKEKILAHLSGTIPLNALTPDDGTRWRQSLAKSGLSDATVRSCVGDAKTILADAVRRRMIAENPFEHLVGGVTPSSNTRYVTPEETRRIINACPNASWKLLFGLTRLAGLRSPSETHILTWADVNWELGRLTVRSPKTERHAGHKSRVVPIMPELMKLLQARYDEVQPGESPRLVTMRGGFITERIRQYARAAGVEEWEDRFQTLRRSCEKEWALKFPQYVVSKWIGHSIAVSGRHYANAVPEHVMDEAAGVVRPEATRQTAQQAPAPIGMRRQNDSGSRGQGGGELELCRAVPTDADVCLVPEKAGAGFKSHRPDSPVKPKATARTSGNAPDDARRKSGGKRTAWPNVDDLPDGGAEGTLARLIDGTRRLCSDQDGPTS